MSYGGESPYSTPSAEDNDPDVDFEVPNPETSGPVAYEPKICGPVICEPVVLETGGPELCVTIVFFGLT